MDSGQLGHWKGFQFFEQSDAPAEAKESLRHLEVTCVTYGRGYLIFGDAEGTIRCYNRNFSCEETIQGFSEAVTHLKQIKSNKEALIAAIGNDDGGTIRIWTQDRRDMNGNYLRIRDHRIFPRDRPPAEPISIFLNPDIDVRFLGNSSGQGQEGEDVHEVHWTSITSSVTCFDIDESLNYIAIGKTDGEVFLVKGDVMTEKRFNPRECNVESMQGQYSVSFLAFAPSADERDTILYVVYSDSCTAAMVVEAKGEERLIPIANHGGKPTMCCMSDNNELIVAHAGFISFYTNVGRTSCYTMEATQRILRKLEYFRGCLFGIFQDGHGDASFHVTIYDLRNRLKAFTNQKVLENVSFLISEWGQLYIMTNESNSRVSTHVQLLTERDTQTKLELLFQRNLYEQAAALAKHQQFDFAYLTEIHRKHGDHLFNKGDFDKAVHQYILTLGKLEPSYVIRKFLEPQHLTRLTTYLEALHERGMATAEHTTLLLNQYTKLQDAETLNRFIHETGTRLSYDVEIAVKACRAAGYYEHALYLALNHKAHNWFLKVQIEDLSNHNEALNYIKGLDATNAAESLRAWGKVLVSKLPEDTTRTLIDVCTGWKGDVEVQTNAESAAPELFMNAFVDCPYYLLIFLEGVVHKNVSDLSQVSPRIWNSLLELYLTKWLPRQTSKAGTRVQMEWTSLSEADWRQRREKGLRLLRNPEARFDAEYALVLVQRHDFTEGLVLLYEKLNMFDDLVEHYMQRQDHNKVIAFARRYGERNSRLWHRVLMYFVTNNSQDFSEEIVEVVRHIEKFHLLPPLTVLQTLALNGKTRLDAVKDYFLRALQDDMLAIVNSRLQLEKTKREINGVETALEECTRGAMTHQNTKCVLCQDTLDLPAIHFKCKHSYHKRCVDKPTDPCPMCAENDTKLHAKLKEYSELSRDHAAFERKLEDSTQLGVEARFNVVAEQFSKCIFAQEGEAGELAELVDEADEDEQMAAAGGDAEAAQMEDEDV